MDIVISGSSGLIGTALCKSLKQQGHRPIRLVRRTPKKNTDEIYWKPSDGQIDTQSLEGVGAVVHLAGAGIGNKRWNAKYKDLLITSRTHPTCLLANKIASSKKPCKVFLSGSAIGYYGTRGNETLTESSPPGNNFLAKDLTVKWEKAAQPTIDAGIRTVFLRTGIVLSPEGGVLSKMLPLFKIALGGKFGDGKQYMSWISIDDEVDAIIHLIETEISGPVNLVSPTPITNQEFTKALGTKLNRPTFFSVPRFAPKLLLGSEMAQALLFDSQRALPETLVQSGFKYKHATIKAALDHIL